MHLTRRLLAGRAAGTHLQQQGAVHILRHRHLPDASIHLPEGWQASVVCHLLQVSTCLLIRQMSLLPDLYTCPHGCDRHARSCCSPVHHAMRSAAITATGSGQALGPWSSLWSVPILDPMCRQQYGIDGLSMDQPLLISTSGNRKSRSECCMHWQGTGMRGSHLHGQLLSMAGIGGTCTCRALVDHSPPFVPHRRLCMPGMSGWQLMVNDQARLDLCMRADSRASLWDGAGRLCT